MLLSDGKTQVGRPSAEAAQEAYDAGVAPPVVLASTHERATEVVSLEALREHAVDVPADPSTLT